MSLRLIVRPLAEQDLVEAHEWYEEQRIGLGDEFRGVVDGLMGRILDRPQIYPKVHHDVRRAVLRRFPYLLYYIARRDAVVVLGCLHSKRDPALLESRLP